MSFMSIAVILMLIISLTNAEKICSSYGFVPEPQNCKSTCSPTNDECLLGTKCCHRIKHPCGFHCVRPKDNIEKLGQCPTIQTGESLWYLCDAFFCDVDNDCQGTEKCCSNSCGSKICFTPQ